MIEFIRRKHKGSLEKRKCLKSSDPLSEPLWFQRLLIGVSFGFLTLFLLLPLLYLFVYAFGEGLSVYFSALVEPEALAAIKLTLTAAFFAVTVNTVFGVCAAWAITKFSFRGKSFIITIIDLPFAVSPVIAGLVFVLLFGGRGWLGPWLLEHDIRIIFAVPAIILATMFVTLPFVVRELIPVMQEQGAVEEETALTLGAGGFRTFIKITLPNIKWALAYGILLCNARAMGEFGAVSVVSGHIRGMTNTVPLYVEILYNDYQITSAFALASILSLLALLTLMIKTIMDRRNKDISGYE